MEEINLNKFELLMYIKEQLSDFDPKAAQIIDNNSGNFNISFEIELEPINKNKYINPFKFNTIPELQNNIKELYFNLTGCNIEQLSVISENKPAYESLLTKLFNGKENIVESLFADDLTCPAETKISLLIRRLITSRYFKYNKQNGITGIEDCLTDELKRNFPNFFNRYKDIIEVKSDLTLIAGGFEIVTNKKKIYLSSLQEAIDYLEIFYADYSAINNLFFFTEKTGLHINISLGNKTKEDYNVIKGILFLNDHTSDGSVPIVFKDNSVRMDNYWCRSAMKEFVDYIKHNSGEPYVGLPWKIKKFNDLNNKTNIIPELKAGLTEEFNLKKLEHLFNKVMFDFVYHYGKKQIGFNICNIKESGYVEFRFNGHTISKDTIVSKLMYYCYIVVIMTSKDFLEKEYEHELKDFSRQLKQIFMGN
jgi:hypothetical protein